MMKRFTYFLVTFLTMLASLQLAAQEYDTKSKKAIRYFEEGVTNYKYKYFDKAFESVALALEADSNFVDPYLLRAHMNQELGKPQEAKTDFLKAIAINPEHDARTYYNLALAESELLEINEALMHVKRYQEFDLSSRQQTRAKELQEVLTFRLTLVNNPVPFDPINLGKQINGPYTEHSPSLRADEQVLYFTRRYPAKRKGPGSTKYDEDLFYSILQPDGSWGIAKDLGNTINTHYREGASCVSPDGKYLFFTSCDRPKGLGSCDLYIAFRQGDQWVKPRNLGSNVNSRFWESQPTFSSDGRTLFFVSNRAGKGKQDIWMTRIGNDSQWTKPVNLSINTKGSDQSPFIHPDGKTLYFASDEHLGLGKHDLFVTTVLDEEGNCSEPVNLGYPINSTEDDVSLMVSANGKLAYYASGMEGGFGEWDLYRFELPEEVRPVSVTYSKGLVYDRDTKAPLGAKFELIDLETQKTVVESYADKTNGEFLVSIPVDRDYALNVSAKGYLFFSENFSLKEQAEQDAYAFDVPMIPIQKGERVVLKNIFFETNKYALKPTSKAELDKLVAFLNNNAAVSIEIGGHTDNVGSKQYNQDLSEKRAKSVYEYLVEQGIVADRLAFKGYNFEEPVATNDTEEGRAQNRRTEFKILSNE